jgi:hypothetical protein
VIFQPLLLTLPLLEPRLVDGWLVDKEAELLLARRRGLA